MNNEELAKIKEDCIYRVGGLFVQQKYENYVDFFSLDLNCIFTQISIYLL